MQVRDAEACLKLAPRFAKAHFAKGRALYFMSDYEAAFAQYDAGLGIEHHPRIEAWLEAERHKPEYATHAGPRALVGRLAAAVRANDVRRLALVLGRCPAQARTAPSSYRRWADAPQRRPHSMFTRCRAYCVCYPPYDPPYTLLRLLNVRIVLYSHSLTTLTTLTRSSRAVCTWRGVGCSCLCCTWRPWRARWAILMLHRATPSYHATAPLQGGLRAACVLLLLLLLHLLSRYTIPTRSTVCCCCCSAGRRLVAAIR